MTSPPTDSTPPRLTWTTGSLLPADVHDELLGPGAPFEIVTEDVLGTPMEVFARRHTNLPQLLADAVSDAADQPFLVDGDRRWTFAEVAESAARIAGVLRDEYGVAKGDRVAIVAANSPEYVLAAWATLMLGALVTGLNGWWSAPEIAYGIELTAPTVLLGDERRLARLDELDQRPHVPTLELVDLVARSTGRPEVTPDPTIAEDDPAVILFTSGTTGRPKGATLSHRNILNVSRSSQLAAAIGARLQPRRGPLPQPAAMAVSPMFHVSGLMGFTMSGPTLRQRLVFLPPGKWDETAHLELTEEHHVTAWNAVPTQFWRLLRHPRFDDFDLSSLRLITSGGAVFPPELVRTLHDKLPNAVRTNGFGMTESAGWGLLAAGPVFDARPDSVGVAQVLCQVEVRDPATGAAVPLGDIGEIHLRHPSIFLGYWDNAEATTQALDADRWYRTGDFGRIDDGVLVLESRMRDLIIRGGENIYPIEIENRLIEHPAIADAAIVGVDHDILGQEVKAFIVVDPGSQVDASEVQRWVAKGLAHFKVPTHVEFRDSLPYSLTGKLLKSELEGRTPAAPVAPPTESSSTIPEESDRDIS